MVNNSATKEAKGDAKKTDSKTSPVKKLTHLYLNDKFISNLHGVSVSTNLTVLYLHNNNISKIDNINPAINLTSLYLQKNKIAKIENIDCLKNLRKLYIGHNEISVVEGLENLMNLEELHIEKQRLTGDSLCFDPRSILGIAIQVGNTDFRLLYVGLHTLSKKNSIQLLNTSHNNMTSVACLSPLKYIKMVNISYNKLRDINDLSDTVSNWHYLREATFVGNPIVKQHRYRENVIANTFRLNTLDGKDINETTRCFIKRFEQEKLNQTSKHSINLADKIPGLPKNYPLPVQKAISQAILNHTKPCFDDTTLRSDVTDSYLPWKALPKSATNIGKNLEKGSRQQKRSAANKLGLSTVIPKL